jgi:hypothetical protein
MHPNKKISLESVSKYLALFVPLTFALSVLHDSGFYRALGISFTDLPLTWTDQFRFSLSWIPETLLIYLIFFIAVVVMKKGENLLQQLDSDINKLIAALPKETPLLKAEDEELTKLDKYSRFGEKIKIIGYLIVAISLSYSALSWILFGDTFSPSGGKLPLVWAILFTWLGFSRKSYVRSWFESLQWLAIILAPAILWWVYFTGFYSASLNKFDLVKIEKKNSQPIIGGYRLIRVYEKGVLITDGKNLLFVFGDEINAIQRDQMRYRFKGILGS